MTNVPERTSGFKAVGGDKAKPATLLRQLGIASATALVISNMVGAGIYGTTGYLAGDLGNVKLVLLIWVVGAVVALAGAICYSELGINYPSSGGEYVYLTRAYGPTWGFMTGWVSFFAGFSAPIAASALIFSEYLSHFFPALKQDHVFFALGGGVLPLKLGGAQLAASGLIVAFTLLNCAGLGRVGKVQNLLTTANLAVILAFIVLGLMAGTGNWGNFSLPAERTSSIPLAAQFAISLFFIYFCYSGWNASTYVAEELERPERTLPLALTLGTALVAGLYLALNVVFIYALPLEKMKGVGAIGSSAAKALFPPETAALFSGLVALALMASVNAMVTIGPRVYYAMAQNGAFFRWAGKVHPRSHTQVNAILCQGACAVLMTMTPFPDLVMYIGFLLSFFAVLAVCSLFVFRRRPGWQKLRVVSFAYPLVPMVFILVGAWMIVYGLIYGLKNKPMAPIAAIATVAIGALVYRGWLRGRLAKG
jgi:APA family basic amino acid/polyamine antiporter